jgi:hypothetical protein
VQEFKKDKTNKAQQYRSPLAITEIEKINLVNSIQKVSKQNI